MSVVKILLDYIFGVTFILKNVNDSTKREFFYVFFFSIRYYVFVLCAFCSGLSTIQYQSRPNTIIEITNNRQNVSSKCFKFAEHHTELGNYIHVTRHVFLKTSMTYRGLYVVL